MSQHRRFSHLSLAVALGLSIAAGAIVSVARACPFCNAVQTTFDDEINQSSAAAIVQLATAPVVADDPTNSGGLNVAPSTANFKILDVLKKPAKDKTVAVGKTLELVYFGEKPVGTTFLVMGIDVPGITWGTPIPLSARGVKYVHDSLKLPPTGAERLEYFMNFLEFDDAGSDLLARDAYDEFGKAPYSELRLIKGKLPHDKLVGWITGDNVSPSHQRLYLTLLGLCGSEKDYPLLEKMIKSDDPKDHAALDAAASCYLLLKGADGLPLIEDRFLKAKPNGGSKDDYPSTYSAIMAVRFQAQENKNIPRPRLAQALRLVLDRPEVADLVIPDLARWEDWSVVDRLATLFKNATDETSWVRAPIVSYLTVCPEPKAKEYLVELKKIDPKAFKQAEAMSLFGGGPAPAGNLAPAASATPAALSGVAGSSTTPAADGAKKPTDAAPPATSQGSDAKPKSDAGKASATKPGSAQPTSSAAPNSAAPNSAAPNSAAPNSAAPSDATSQKAAAAPASEAAERLKIGGKADTGAELTAAARAGDRAPVIQLSAGQIFGWAAGAVFALLVVFWLLMRGAPSHSPG